jgi:hypothetical protein
MQLPMNSPVQVPQELPQRNKTPVVWAKHTLTSKKMALKLKQRMGSDLVAMNVKNLSFAQLIAHEGVYFVVSAFGFARPPHDAKVFLTTRQPNLSQAVCFAIHRGCLWKYNDGRSIVRLGTDRVTTTAKAGSESSIATSNHGCHEWQSGTTETF